MPKSIAIAKRQPFENNMYDNV